MRSWLGPLIVLLCACQQDGAVPQATPVAKFGHYSAPSHEALPAEALPGGTTTHVSLRPGTALSADAFSHPAANLPARARGLFAVGNSFFSNPWVGAPASVAARDGLGPLFSAAACQDCHIRDGRGKAPGGPDEPITAAIVRLAGGDGEPHPVYGPQLQTRALAGVPPEADVRLEWREFVEQFPDGTDMALRRPRLLASDWSHGDDGVAGLALRLPPPMIGLGLLEAIPDQALIAQAEKSTGRLHRVRDPDTGAPAIGRFGWKAAQVSVRHQSLLALQQDMGITSTLFPQDHCSEAQSACLALPNGGAPELEPQIERALVFYARHLAPPARRDYDRPEVRQGEALFASLGCAACHRPSWHTAADAAAPALAGQHIFPYTDLLLHDLGPGLAEPMPEGEATGREWRTAPLWGLGQTHSVTGAGAGFLHDGRARTLAEAIWWHGGQAQAARDAWLALPAPERRRLIRFLATL